MGYTSIRLYHFRNLEDAEISFQARDVFLIGENGQGKTNLLEAIYMLCYGGSFRTRSDNLICRHGEHEMMLVGSLETADGEQHEIRYRWQHHRRSVMLDDSAVDDRKELVHVMPCIIFGHEDIHFVNGPPEMQRFFFDQTLSLNDPLYIDILRRYRRILRARNDALKERRTELVDVYDRQLAEHGMELVRQRAATVRQLNTTFTELFSRISGLTERLRIHYRPSWNKDQQTDETERRLREQRNSDLRFGTTTSGPHRDRYVFDADGTDFTETASTGQLRLLSLVLRASQSVFFHTIVGKEPLLLLDDVLLELDQRRRERFLDALPRYEQAFFTFLPNEQYERYLHDAAAAYRVEDGRLRSLSHRTVHPPSP